MRRFLLVFLVMVMSTLLTSNISWGQCHQNDDGVCDTMYLEPHDYAGIASLPAFVTVRIKVTHDVPTAATDSLAGMIIPLCYTSSSSAGYCSVSGWWNNNNVFPFPDLDRSIFRHFYPDTNRMMTYGEDFTMRDWDTKDLTLDGDSTFWLSLIATGTGDQRWGEGSQVLLATMTFRISDTTTICIDSCFWPPTGRLDWSNGDGTVFNPKFTGECFKADTAGDAVREVPGSEGNRPSEFSLSQNYPNPFNPETYIEFGLSKAAHVEIDIFNIVGQRVRTLVDEEMEPGNYVADWDSKDEQGHSVSSGIYFYRMTAEDFSDMKKMLLVK
ncbi:MAG: T9SS type A sorting domain-containing protein [Candidatus Zixiibacteriota bacterium]|nr:MAG: T9SS type A sorting domain-containing protein [candidate division Zixibacteria bacterium]